MGKGSGAEVRQGKSHRSGSQQCEACPLQHCPLREPVQPTTLPSLDDSDDVIHLDVQLVRLLKVLKGPHVSRLSLGAQTGGRSAQE